MPSWTKLIGGELKSCASFTYDRVQDEEKGVEAHLKPTMEAARHQRAYLRQDLGKSQAVAAKS